MNECFRPIPFSETGDTHGVEGITLHDVQKPVAFATWQMPEFQTHWVGKPECFDTGTRFVFGDMTVGDTLVTLSLLASNEHIPSDWKKTVSHESLIAIQQAFKKISSVCGMLGTVREVLFCMYQPVNPETNEHANGYAPTAFVQDANESTGIREVSSGTIALFPGAYTDEQAKKPYRDTIADIPHLQGIVIHEWVHQFMASEQASLFLDWIQFVPGWRKGEHGYVYEGTPLPTAYAMTNPVDDFVESMTLAICSPEALSSTHPERYLFCTQFIELLKSM